MRTRASLAVAAICAAAVSCADTVADEINALKDEIKTNSIDRTSKCRWWTAWYLDQCTEAEREAILERNIAAHRRWIELAGGESGDAMRQAKPRASLGKTLAVGGRWREAETELAAAVSSGDLSGGELADARWVLADCLWERGDKDGAKRLVGEIAAMKMKSGASYVHDRAVFLNWQWTDPEADLDEFKLPHSVDGKPFPTPQKAEYGEKRVSLAKVETVGLEPDDPIARLLKRKLTRFGAEFASGGTRITIEISPDAPVDKPQGYELRIEGEERQHGQLETTTGKSCPALSKLSSKSTTARVSIKARDRLGALWGVVSFLQCIDRGDAGDGNPEPSKPSIRVLRIEDWPQCLRRGVWESIWHPEYLEYALFNKMSSLVVKFGRPMCGFVFSGLDREAIRLSIARYRDFGFEVFWSARELSVLPVLPLSSPRTRALHLNWMTLAATYGAHACFEMDDTRFYPLGLHPLDVKAAGTATNLDARYLTGIYREMKSRFPSFRLMFGPPFYFGPDGAVGKTWYPEPREPYLKSIGEFLDPEIEVYWTGPKVKSAKFTPEKIAWYSELIGRKPVIYHNGDCLGIHNFSNYGVDAPAYKKSHCRETFDLVAAFYQNTNFYSEMCRVCPAMDWCWNPEAHDADTAVRRATEQLEGSGVYEPLAAAIPVVSYLDKYPRGRPHAELFLEDQDNLDRIAACAEEAWGKASAAAKNGCAFVSGFKDGALAYATKLAGLRRNPPKWLIEQRDAELANTSFAEHEVGYSRENGDQFLPAEMISGGRYFSAIRDDTDRKACPCKELGVGVSVTGRFTVDPFPPERAPKLIVTGCGFRDGTDRDAKVAMPEIELELNGRKIWNGKMFADGQFKPFELGLPVYMLQRSNTFTIRNADKDDYPHRRRPMVHYVVIRK